MHSTIPDNLSRNEFKLLLHLAYFHIPPYFDDIYVTFINEESNSAVLLVLLLSLQDKAYVRIAESNRPGESDEPGFNYALFELSELGRNIANTYNHIGDTPVLLNAKLALSFTV